MLCVRAHGSNITSIRSYLMLRLMLLLVSRCLNFTVLALLLMEKTGLEGNWLSPLSLLPLCFHSKLLDHSFLWISIKYELKIKVIWSFIQVWLNCSSKPIYCLCNLTTNENRKSSTISCNQPFILCQALMKSIASGCL
jgi:hypothetical protein